VLKRNEMTGMQRKKGWKRTGKHNKEGREGRGMKIEDMSYEHIGREK
jgi:hypothetical protein